MPNTPKVPLFDGKKKKLQRQEQERQQDAILQRAALEAQEASKAATFKFLINFLEDSIWSDQLEQISITYDALPPIQELFTYGELSETEGTHACRRLFKAVVIWDDLGHGLWKNLSNKTRQSGRISRELLSSFQGSREGSTSGYPTPERSRNNSRSSVESRFSRKSRQQSTDSQEQDAANCSRRASVADLASSFRKGSSGKVPVRRSTDSQLPLAPPAETISRVGTPSRYRLPKMIPNGCANAVRKTMGSFGESMIQGHGSAL
ncbi:hypothetical protein AK830_g3240 [Neonectria ditissima]|uniref:Uncharacterized protein n=1 Tax=Neonectria ditissima TaxID=78410 RepID=A0A0P7BQV8_9HYPO|nr:hypothetical protein AK830_g3240 [Neonectria ditissima]